MSASTPRIHIRWLIRRDMSAVLAIERESFKFPWTMEDFVRCLRGRSCIAMVAEQGERVVGYLVYELQRTRLRLLNFAVAKASRRQGIGRQLIEKLAGKLSPTKRDRITFQVRETNLQALLFFKNVGARATGVLRDYYEECDGDAIVMELSLADADEPAGRRQQQQGDHP